MALDYRALNRFPVIRTFSGSTSNTQIQVPANAGYMTIQSPAHKILVSFDGEDGEPPSAHRIEILSGGSIEFRLAKGYNRSTSVYIATSSSSAADINIMFEE